MNEVTSASRVVTHTSIYYRIIVDVYKRQAILHLYE